MPVESALPAVIAAWKAWRRRHKIWLVSVFLAAVLLVGLAVVILAVNWPFTRQALVHVLQERSVRSVSIGSFRTTYFPPGCVAEQISFLHREHKNKPPLITIEKLVVKGSYWSFISLHKYLSEVRVSGMHVTVPPSNPDSGPNPIMPLTHGTSGRPLIIGSVIADGTVLDFVQRTPGKPPFRLDVHKLQLENVGNNLPLKYRAVIYNSNPPGTIESAGRFGVWNTDDPGSTPVHGWYRLRNANLGVYRIMSGILQSTGAFDGILGAIAVKGSAIVPDFHVNESAHTCELRAEFDATVAATDGNVDLNAVTARFDHSILTVKGFVRGQPKERGKAVFLNIHSSAARVDDLINLVTEDRQSPMTGSLALETQVALPQGAASFLRDMEVNGTFRVAAARFTNQEIARFDEDQQQRRKER